MLFVVLARMNSPFIATRGARQANARSAESHVLLVLSLIL